MEQAMIQLLYSGSVSVKQKTVTRYQSNKVSIP